MTPAPRLQLSFSVLVPLMLLSSCIPAPAPSFESDSPNARLEAIAAASNATDETSLGQLVGQLDADDPAARMLAITALHKRTGETLGYRAGDPDWKRREAKERWDEFLQGPATPENPEAADPEAGEPEPAQPESGGEVADG
ncbi:MAG: hypothetical protein ACI89L_002657 [Phycisphaerales bacterium]|jgi:hypothetical protein